jgi:tRNA(Arg) A34 adenosine deaminase TadA
MNRPHLEILSEHASRQAWQLCIREAERSPMHKFGTGAVLLDRRGRTISSGCSHRHSGNMALASVHAELHCLRRAPNDLRGATILLYTVGKSGSAARSSRPCLACARNLVHRGVERAVYPVRTSRGWRIEEDDLCDSEQSLVYGSDQFETHHCFARANKRALVA